MTSTTALSNDLSRQFRAEMPVSARYAYFDHAAVAPLPLSAAGAIRQWLVEATEQGDVGWLKWAEQVEQFRRSTASLVGADPAEIALVPNTTSGIAIVAEGWPWQAGDNVVTLANEFPSNAYPWMNLASRGVETRLAPVDGGRVDLQRIADACDARTRIVSVSWVGYASGWRIDLAELAALCRRKGVRLMVDAIQGLGVFPVDVHKLEIDFLAADGHKWLLGPEGAGLLYVRRELIERLRPLNVGWHSVKPGGDIGQIEMNLRDDAARCEGGTQNMVGMIGLGASIELLIRLGLRSDASPIAEQVLKVADRLCERLREIGAMILSPHDGEHRSGIVTFEPPGPLPPQQVRKRLLEAGVVTSCRGGGLRVAPHGYANDDDLERLVAGLLECRSHA